MKWLCRLGGHEAAADDVYNSGFHFGRCCRCGCQMIRCGAAWEAVPKGHRVVWKAGRHNHSIDPDYAAVLPVLHREANLPAVRPPSASWSRQLVRAATRARGGRTAAEATEAEAEARLDADYPPLLVIAALVGAGLQLLFAFGGRRGGLA